VPEAWFYRNQSCQGTVVVEKEHEDGRLDGTAYRRAVGRIEGYMAQYPGIDERTANPHPVMRQR
jgi:hypothetical protein